MNKAISTLFFILLLRFIISTSPSPTAIIAIAPRSRCILDSPIEISIEFTSIIAGDIIYFSTNASNIPTMFFIEFTSPIIAPIAKFISFTNAGIYNLYLQRNGVVIEQTNAGVQLVITPPPPESNDITAVNPMIAGIGEAVSFTFTLQSLSSLQVNDLIILSTENMPRSTDPEIDVFKAPSTNSFTGSVTFKTAGKYFVFIDNGSITKQTTSGLSILVSSAQFQYIAVILLFYIVLL